MPRRADRVDVVCAVALAALTVASRLPYRARLLYNWDAVQFALALREYDVAKHQPHPPGYILYVALGRLADAVLGDPAAAYVLLAVGFSGLTTLVVYALARLAYDRPTALTAAAVLAVSPVSWFYGSVGLTYSAEALFASTVAYFALRARRGSATDSWLAAGYLGVAGGFRQSLLALLLPLWLGSTVLGTRRPRVVLVGLGILGAAALTWFVPMVWLTGGLGRYLAASADLAETVVIPTSAMTGRLEITLRMSRYLLESVLVGLGPLALAVALLPWYVRRRGWSATESTLALWTAPPVLVYTLVHFGQAGYVLTFLPALVILLSRVLVAALTELPWLVRRPGMRPAVTAVAVGLVIVTNGSFFVSARPAPRDFDTPMPAWKRLAHDEAHDWVFSRTAAALREHEDVVATFVGAIRGLHPAGETAIITEIGNPRSYPWLRHAMYYLSEYPVYELRVGAPPLGFYAPTLASAMSPLLGSTITLPWTVRRLVWFVDHWSPSTGRPEGLVEIELPHGRYLYVLPVGPTPIEYAGYVFVREEPPPRARAG